MARSEWKVCEHFQRGGNWRHLIVRSNRLGQVMAVVVIHPQDLDKDQIHSEMLRLRDHMLAMDGAHDLVSLYYQTWYDELLT